MRYIALLALAMASHAASESIQNCGGQPYYPSQYTCYGNFLCPVIGGERTLKCNNACYLSEAYTCSNGQLVQHPAQKATFTVHVVQAPIAALANKQLNACSQHFFLGNTATCTYCPDQAARSGVCASVTNTTIFSGSSMAVVVPGGQQTYIGPDGAFGFTQAHSASIPTGSEIGATAAYDHGYFNYVGGSGGAGSSSPQGWLACPSGDGVWKLFGKRAGLAFPANCMSINLAVTTAPSGKYGAWQYV